MRNTTRKTGDAGVHPMGVVPRVDLAGEMDTVVFRNSVRLPPTLPGRSPRPC